MRVKTVRIQNFKRFEQLDVDLGTLDCLVGANNSGKSSVIQALHFAVALLQTIALTKKFTSSSESLKTSLAPNQLIYSPSEDAYALGAGATDL